ncbi:unnamed protein product [Plutella xylostella]|uniref:Coiled-coil-helix-coiled-coil-helix domain-containing protein 7 n=1 Tax=Plutella xylostella TaxID=51655 RepID=A0A8S4FYH1_PLUXY|nr:coiled-coil-helix-coiled-coil-helix domain-containing protein 7 [Plutella xylostella]CAG9131620.1 unnamed protein product [Plutella xylostella]
MTKLINNSAARLNPCLKEQDQSYNCLDKNNYDHEKCQVYFDNYNICKKFWGQVYRDRKAKGIHPFLPDIEEREKIRMEHLNMNK